MPRKTLAMRAQELGITQAVLQNAKSDGINPWRDDEMKPWLAKRRPRVNSKAKVTGPPPGDDKPATSPATIEELEIQVRLAESYDEVKVIKEKIAALLQAQKVRKEEGELLPRREVDERDTRIAAAVKGALLKFCNDVPPMIEGQTASKAQKTIKAQMLGILEQLASDQSEFWKESHV